MKTRIIALSFAAPIVLSSCVNIDKGMYKAYNEMRTEKNAFIHKTITDFTTSLECMDQLLMNKRVRYTSILIEALNDKTDQVKAGTRDMLISAISEMTTKSKKIKIIAYGKDSANLISFLNSAGAKNTYKNIPHYDIRGSISQFDKSLIQTDNSIGGFLRGKYSTGVGKSKAASLDIMSLDLSAVYTRDMSVVPGVTSKNTIAIYRRGDSLNADARINKLGVYFDMGLSRSEGKSQALRNLIELAAIELMGKLTKVPYWTCLGTKSPSEMFEQKPEHQKKKEKKRKQSKKKNILKRVKDKVFDGLPIGTDS